MNKKEMEDIEKRIIGNIHAAFLTFGDNLGKLEGNLHDWRKGIKEVIDSTFEAK